MRAYSFIIGAVVGGAVAYYYMNHQSDIKRSSYQVKARYNKVKDTVSDVASDMADDLGDIIGKQES
ncbi:MAG: hypothetical protein M0P20_09825 [Methanocorpusculum sp.]|nr:hypothetical protein [Methanocorpusculum sp.]